MTKIKILQIGPHSYIGGVSIHIKRLTSILRDEFEFNYIDESPANLTPKRDLNVRRFKDQLTILKTIKKQDLIHIHSGNWLLRLYFIFFTTLFNKPFIVTLHSYRLKGFKAKITEHFLIKARLIIAVSKEIEEKLPKKIKKSTIIKEAFIPPQMKYEPDLPSKVSAIVQRMNKQKKFVISANAFRLTAYNNGELYGLDLCIEIAELAKGNNLKIHIIFIIGTIRGDDKEYYNSFITLIKKHQLEDFITIIPEKLSFVRLIEKSDLVLRPTLSDGDAITIREALFLNKKVLASDVVARPEGTYLYRTGKATDLFSNIEKIILENYKEKKDLNSLNNFKKEYTEIYNKCNNSHKN